MTFEELLMSLQGSAIEVAVGMLLSWIAEYIPAYGDLSAKLKRVVMMAACFGLPSLAALVSVLMGYQPWSFEATFWPAIWAGGVVFFGSQAAHVRKL